MADEKTVAPVQPTPQPTKSAVRQLRPREASTGVDYTLAPRRFDTWDCRNAWRRPYGFLLAGILIVLGLLTLVLGVVQLAKDGDVDIASIIVPCVILVIGIAFLAAVKFYGHKFKCPSQSQLLKQQQEQEQQHRI